MRFPIQNQQTWQRLPYWVTRKDKGRGIVAGDGWIRRSGDVLGAHNLSSFR